ncbi:FGGY-family carbohydrate kinase [Calorimonas adulescens]|uniref:FGGY-family carbohydrate kinase n=1 Tax=Calorimonas adulescens TaxID=2606906 RepID=UPI0023AE9E24|nr:FGGY-family carbohydrate kinase [Calorimonas adulescens]
MYLPYLIGERTPHIDPDARGVFFGLSAIHEKRDLIRAIMEGVAFSLLDALNLIKTTSVGIDEMFLCGGGGTSPLWRKIICDIFDCPVKTIISKEGSAIGVALLSAVVSGIYKSVQEAAAIAIKTDTVCYPKIKNTKEHMMKYYKIYRNLYPTLKEVFKKLSKISGATHTF